MQEPYLDVNGLPLLISCRVLKTTRAQGLMLEAGKVMSIQLRIALALIRLGYVERKYPKRRKPGSQRRRERAARILASQASGIEKVE